MRNGGGGVAATTDPALTDQLRRPREVLRKQAEPKNAQRGAKKTHAGTTHTTHVATHCLTCRIDERGAGLHAPTMEEQSVGKALQVYLT